MKKKYRNYIKPYFREKFFSFLRKVWNTPDVKEFTTETLKGLLAWKPDFSIMKQVDPNKDYPELGKYSIKNETCNRSDIIFVTGRFRSGTTLLWNIFRHTKGVIAYYEPFNERRWFDPKIRGNYTDTTHKGVSNYWQEYENMEFLVKYYEEWWINKNLYMDRDFWAPKMKRYIELLIENARGRPVLQFNRVDFRLSWLKANFPKAKIIHIYRNPRDQWCSFLRDINAFSPKDKIEEFYSKDGFYLLTWCEDLKYHFPFLDPCQASHPYELFYYLWYLSFIFGKSFADFSFSFESLIESPESVISRMYELLGLQSLDEIILNKLIKRPLIGKWRQYADDKWFKDIESKCERDLHDFIFLNFTNKK